MTLTPNHVAAAAQRLQGIANKTPIITSRTLNARVDREVFLKCENFQRVGAFKFRGAYNAISQLSAEQKAAGVITHSSGNHAQGVALAAQLLGIKATIVMPHDAPGIKRDATAGYGATIVPCEALHREQVTADLVNQHGFTLIHPYDNDQIIAGQGTAAWELFEEAGQLDALFVPVGGGGLISGSALAAAQKSPQCQVIGVEPELAADANHSWRNKKIHTLDYVPATIADGLRTRFIGQRNLAIMVQYLSDMTTVSESSILETLEFLWARLKIIVEPSSAVALAPLFSGTYATAGQRVGVILSGGNVDVPACGFFHRGRPDKTTPPLPAQATEKTTVTAPESETSQPRILVCGDVDAAAIAILEETAVVDTVTDLSDEQLLREIGQYQALVIGPQMRVRGQLIEYGFNLRAIGSVNARLDNIDVSTARDMGIEVVNAPGGNEVTIAEHTIARLLMLATSFGDGRLSGKTLGLVGFGRVGRQVAQRAQAFDMNILVNQPRLTPELALSAGVQATDLVDLLQAADFVTIHVPFRTETNAIIGQKELNYLRPAACLVNTGHTDLVDDKALLDALENGLLAGAALSALPPEIKPASPAAAKVRQHPKVIVAPHVTTIIDSQIRDVAIHVARRIKKIVQVGQASASLSLELVPIEQVIPHEQIDEKRVRRLMKRLEDDGRLVNPPVTTFWNGRYIVLDGATRSTAFKWLGYPHLIVQVVPAARKEYELHTWYHAISSPDSFAALTGHLNLIDGLQLQRLASTEVQAVFRQPDALCYFLDRDGNKTVAKAIAGADRLQVMNNLVAAYTKWGNVERTLLTDQTRLMAQFPQMTAVAIFPQFKPEEVFETASRGELLPAGLTRFVIPGRILRLNAELARLKQDEPLAAKRAWFNEFLAEKLARSRLRYYQEPVILLDE